MRRIELASWRGFGPHHVLSLYSFMKITDSQKIEIIVSMNLFGVKGWRS